MHPLSQRVNARVRPAGAGDSQPFLAGQLPQGLFQHLLHRQRVLLALPARVGRAIVADGQQHPALSLRAAALDEGQQLGHSRFHLLHRMVTSSAATVTSEACQSIFWKCSTRSRVRPSPP